jgi:hypothetical protein
VDPAGGPVPRALKPTVHALYDRLLDLDEVRAHLDREPGLTADERREAAAYAATLDPYPDELLNAAELAVWTPGLPARTYQAALQLARDAHTAKPDSPDNIVLLAAAFLRTGDPAGAARLLAPLADRVKPEKPVGAEARGRTLVFLAMARARRGEVAAAEELLRSFDRWRRGLEGPDPVLDELYREAQRAVEAARPTAKPR